MVFDIKVYNKLKEQHYTTRSKVYLEEISKYLDDCGMDFPMPRYFYDEKDVSTWKFLDGLQSYNQKYDSWSYHDVLNPEFKHG